MTRTQRTLGCALAVAALVALEWGAAMTAPTLYPLRGFGDAAWAWLLLLPLCALAGLHRLGPALLGALLLASMGPHAARLGLPWGLPAALGSIALLAMAAGLRSPDHPRLLWLPLVLAALLAPTPALLAPTPALLAPPVVAMSDSKEEAAAPRDLVLITVDTLRGDAALAPFEGPPWWVFSAAIAPAPWTLPSMDSLMRGAPVRRHGGGLPVEGGYTRPDADWPVLAERLAARGYATAAFVSNPHLSTALGFDRGFSRFEHADDWREPHYALHALFAWRRRLTGQVERLRHRRDPLLVDAALGWWERPAAGPRFLWVHLLLPHEYRRDPRPPGRPLAGEEDIREAYWRNVAATEAELERLIAGLGAEARVVITSDHGELLGEDGRWGHGKSFDDAQLHVPLYMRGFATEASPGRVEQAVALDRLAGGMLTGEMAPLLSSGGAIEVGGIREDAEAFALRTPAGYSPRPPPILDPNRPAPTLEVDGALQEALEAIGYQEPAR